MDVNTEGALMTSLYLSHITLVTFVHIVLTVLWIVSLLIFDVQSQSQSQYDICVALLTVLDSGAEQNKMT